MTYNVIEKTQNEETIITKVEYTIYNNVIITDVSHFMPKSIQEIDQNIINRAYSEKAKLDAISENEILLPQIILNRVTPIN